VTVSDLVAYLHVADVRRSIAFYELLGLEVRDSHGPEGEPAWCWLEAGDARLMLGKAGEPVEAERQAVMFYAYTQDG
jgi:predicted enzyme related to lactoylglutathione lyase